MFVLGAPCAGKTSAATRLRRRDVDVIDTDGEIERLNGGVWPDIETKNEHLLPIVLDLASALPEVVLFNSYMPLDRTLQLKDRGFAIALLDVSASELRRRDRVRLSDEGWSNVEWSDWHQSVITDHLEAGLIDHVIDGERNPDEIVAELIDHIRPHPTTQPLTADAHAIDMPT
jgi:hypothetical protein